VRFHTKKLTTVLVLLLGACGQGGGGAGDAAVDDAPTDAPRGPCWSTDGSQPRGTITLGTGQTTFMPMPDQQPLEYGPQGGFDIQVNAQMTGLLPGNPANILDPDNPRTRFRVFFVDTGESINRGVCPFRLAYVPAATPGTYVLQVGTAVQYEVCYGSQGIFGRQVKVVLEILDSDGGYATTEKIVTPIQPVEANWPDQPNGVPCPPP
jgi:hypothetical protein